MIRVQWVTGVGHDRHLSVTVNAPSGLLVSTVDDAKGQIDFEAEETGFHQMCFSNFHNRFGTMQVFLSFGVYYDGHQDLAASKDEEKKKKEEVRKDLNNTLSVIELRSHEEERRLLPAAVQLAVRHLVVHGPQPPRRHLRVSAAPLPQKALHQQDLHRGREASLLTDSASFARRMFSPAERSRGEASTYGSESKKHPDLSVCIYGGPGATNDTKRLQWPFFFLVFYLCPCISSSNINKHCY
ncbi:uncharacterized protein LOC120793387 isoform X3 [Xiphias gladius]|uniref:uncharacterized protein LOC120793387 isoform X3 n=1 Tax=Xiphias gladius TaxID=8245 RepID=UPI001A99F9D1|nr:uncharacterized protein LOC120793387 isoform X3 [Xiphias gladius]